MTVILFGIVAAIVVLAFVAAFALIGSYNSLVALRNQIDRAWANIDVILKQRFDEIPQLVQVVEQYASYERGTIEKVVEARTRYGQAQNLNEKVQASQEFGVALRGVMAIGENYPELRANAQFVQLQSRVSSLENSIADRRETYNEAVTNFNTRISQIPDAFIAPVLRYSRLDLYKIDPAETVRPSLKMKLPS